MARPGATRFSACPSVLRLIHTKVRNALANLLERLMFSFMAKYLVFTILTGTVLLLLVYVVDEVRGV